MANEHTASTRQSQGRLRDLLLSLIPRTPHIFLSFKSLSLTKKDLPKKIHEKNWCQGSMSLSERTDTKKQMNKEEISEKLKRGKKRRYLQKKTLRTTK